MNLLAEKRSYQLLDTGLYTVSVTGISTSIILRVLNVRWGPFDTNKSSRDHMNVEMVQLRRFSAYEKSSFYHILYGSKLELIDLSSVV